ncbi:MAG TPA: extracellular solute-binding protein [Steroidobacter sp.]|jgi:multiple sugar transport system substrate-binding protein|nr:extracellular solute-binding protein [Steroidobacteraceae bacterium]HLS81492.1 extracellular solute-binding protein [Steroidobacter sp.]
MAKVSSVFRVALVSAAALAGCSEPAAVPTLHWYINPDNGGQTRLAEQCTQQARGRYRIRTALLPRDSTAQREQLVRRLAARDSGVDLMSLDVPYLAEFAHAGFLREFHPQERQALTEGLLEAPLASAVWDGRLFAMPFNANTQLLWVRKSVAEDAGLDLNGQLTWDEIIEAAERTGTTVQVQARRYEGYTVLINSLIMSAGGAILVDPAAGKDAVPAIDSAAGRAAARVIERLANSPAAAPTLANADEGVAQAGFRAANGGFMTNWPFVYTAEAGRPLQEDFGWSRWPAVERGRASAPPLGGVNVAISAFSKRPSLAVEAVACITSPASQKQYMLAEGLLATVESVYDDPEIRAAFPMADLLRESVDEAAPRPLTPYYPDITDVIQRTWHPPASVDQTTPARTARFIVEVLHERRLL